MIKCIQKKENEPQRAEKERGKYKMMKKELTMEELEQVAGGNFEAYYNLFTSALSVGWMLYRRRKPIDEYPVLIPVNNGD